MVPKPDQGALDERIGLPAVMEGDVRRRASLEESADVVERANPFGAKCHFSLETRRPLMLICRWTTLRVDRLDLGRQLRRQS